MAGAVRTLLPLPLGGQGCEQLGVQRRERRTDVALGHSQLSLVRQANAFVPGLDELGATVPAFSTYISIQMDC